MQGTVPDAEQPDVNGIWALRPKSVGRGNHVAANCPAATVHVDRDDLSVVVGFHLPPDVPFVYVVTQASDLVAAATWCGGPG